ncbi:MAG: hypothetical protein LDL13_03115 [Calditerrivibrio sp.]|nr:hypothetical protein [Calditerrivibrio sp.]MCA1932550.1 hypothetical protein [Calditerrivibrio sp.]MCA1980060.1 hypothetical protein [Calditerrivibrio sp.]
MKKLFFLLISFLIIANNIYAYDEERIKILNREKELFEQEKNMNIEFNNRKNMIITNTNECLGRAKTKKEIRDCNKFKKDEMEFLNKELKFRKEQIASEKKQIAEEKKKLSKRKKR